MNKVDKTLVDGYDPKDKIMENRNTLLEKENKKLKEELAQSGSLDKKYKELEKLKDNWETIYIIKICIQLRKNNIID